MKLTWPRRWRDAIAPGTDRRSELDDLVRQALGCQQAARFEDAERFLYRALALEPGSAEIHLLLGDLYRLSGRLDRALHCCLEAVRLAPDMAQAHNNLGNAYRDLGESEQAVTQHRKALALDERLPEAHFNLGLGLQIQGAAEGAMLCYRQALVLRPDFALAHLNMGYLLEENGDAAGSLAAYRGAVESDPALVEAHVNYGMQLLLAGRFAEGWEEYEWRLRYPEYSGADVAARAPRWDGGELGGRTILLDAEQGFGDALQFLRYAPLVAARGGRVLVRCAPELATLAAGTVGVAAVVRRGEALPQFDAWCPLPSLPRAFGTSLASVPAEVPYVHADAGKTARWRVRLAGADGECRVGLVWASQSAHRTAPAKSVSLQALAGLGAVPGVRLYSLQLGAAVRDAQPGSEGMRLVDLGGEFFDFADTAAAVANMDLVISVDTAVAHLAGAMGRPVWTLLKFAPDWRWLLGREDSPWYPTMRLFRQESPDDWRQPVARVQESLRALVAGRTPA
ncbi:MAG: tetratricopeptide repeat-containing glycosyltransferase family protein [Burkholderiales bacterium]